MLLLFGFRVGPAECMLLDREHAGPECPQSEQPLKKFYTVHHRDKFAVGAASCLND